VNIVGQSNSSGFGFGSPFESNGKPVFNETEPEFNGNHPGDAPTPPGGNRPELGVDRPVDDGGMGDGDADADADVDTATDTPADDFMVIEDMAVPLAAFDPGEYDTMIMNDMPVPLGAMPQTTGLADPSSVLFTGVILSAFAAAVVSNSIRKFIKES